VVVALCVECAGARALAFCERAMHCVVIGSVLCLSQILALWLVMSCMPDAHHGLPPVTSQLSRLLLLYI
jgi:hypothetical protein